MKQIVFVTGSMCRGGAERVISLLSDTYVKLGWRVSIVMLLHSYVEYELPPEVEILDFSCVCEKTQAECGSFVYGAELPGDKLCLSGAENSARGVGKN